MSKLIVEMDMPERCAECRVRLSCKWFIYNFLYSNSTEYLKPQIGDPKCLIKGVLPDEYGDLIDRDVLYMAVKSHNTSDAAIARNHNRVTSLQNLSTIRKGYIAEKHICLDDIIRAEAVIKAERKDDEQADC